MSSSSSCTSKWGQRIPGTLSVMLWKLDRMVVHLAITSAPDFCPSWIFALRRMLAMAAQSLSDDGAMSSSWNGAAGRRNGSTGYCHLAVGAGFSGMKTSAILSPGQPAYLHGIIISNLSCACKLSSSHKSSASQ